MGIYVFYLVAMFLIRCVTHNHRKPLQFLQFWLPFVSLYWVIAATSNFVYWLTMACSSLQTTLSVNGIWSHHITYFTFLVTLKCLWSGWRLQILYTGCSVKYQPQHDMTNCPSRGCGVFKFPEISNNSQMVQGRDIVTMED